jgi:monomeric isocitrate dehydrogenase
MRQKLDYLVRKTGRQESEIVAQAVDEGVSELYRKQISDAYISGEIDRKKAILELGETYVEELDFARQAVDADIQWGLKNA